MSSPSQPGVDLPSPPVDKVNQQPPVGVPTPPSSFSATDYQSSDFQQPMPPPATRPEDSAYPQPYHHHHHQSYSHEPQQSFSQNYSPHDSTPPSFSYSNFQSYPSFSETSMPTAPGQYPSYYQGYDSAFANQSGAPASNYRSTMQSHQSGLSGSNYALTAQFSASSENGSHSETMSSSTTPFKYDSNYQPSPEKIAEAHKAARFAVGALAFDDVPVAVDFLRRSLELLTNASSSQ